MTNITFGAALKWLEKQKKDNQDTQGNYNKFHRESEENIAEAEKQEYIAEKLRNSINSLKNGIIAARGNQDLADGLVDLMNNKIQEYQAAEALGQECVENAEKAVKNIENYNTWNFKELFFFYRMMKDMFPDKMPSWIEFEQEHKDFFHSYHYEQYKRFEGL